MRRATHCRACGQPVAPGAVVCASCGRALPKQSRLPKLLLFAGIGFGLLAVIGVMNGAGDGNSTGAVQNDEETNKLGLHAMAAMEGASALKRSMRNPDAFRLEYVFIPDGSDDVCYSYRAQNGFGGMNVQSSILIAKTGKMLTGDDAGFAKAWNRSCGKTSKGHDITKRVASRL